MCTRYFINVKTRSILRRSKFQYELAGPSYSIYSYLEAKKRYMLEDILFYSIRRFFITEYLLRDDIKRKRCEPMHLRY